MNATQVPLTAHRGGPRGDPRAPRPPRNHRWRADSHRRSQRIQLPAQRRAVSRRRPAELRVDAWLCLGVAGTTRAIAPPRKVQQRRTAAAATL